VPELDSDSLEIGPMKARDRSKEKAKDSYSDRVPGPPESWMYDILRATITCPSVEVLLELITWLETNAHIIKAKNRFATPNASGFRAVMFVVQIPVAVADGTYQHCCEIQVKDARMQSLYDKLD
jgi:hypothetical protein